MSEIMTKRALAASLKTLLLRKPLNKITIQDIADECGINRMTFYYHFRDIFDLVEWMCLEESRQALGENRDYETWQQGFLNIFHAVRDNKPFIDNVYRCVGQERVEAYLYPMVHALLYRVAEEEAEGLHVREADKAFLAEFYQYAFVGIMLRWIRDGMQEDPKNVVLRIDAVVRGNMREALQRLCACEDASKQGK